MNTSPVPQCRSLNSKRGDVTTELLAVSPPKGAGSAYLPAPEEPVGMCSTVIAGLGSSCLSNTTFFCGLANAGELTGLLTPLALFLHLC